MKGWVNLGATQCIWTRDPWIGNVLYWLLYWNLLYCLLDYFDKTWKYEPQQWAITQWPLWSRLFCKLFFWISLIHFGIENITLNSCSESKYLLDIVRKVSYSAKIKINKQTELQISSSLLKRSIVHFNFLWLTYDVILDGSLKSSVFVPSCINLTVSLYVGVYLCLCACL